MANSSAASESMESESRRRIHHWKEYEDDKLRQLVEERGPKEWKQIAEHMDGRTGKSCRLRWVNHLDPSVNKDPFTKEEEERLLAAHEQFGARWARIAKQFPGRTDHFVKNAWHVAIGKKRKEEFRRQCLLHHQQNKRSRASSSTGNNNNARALAIKPRESPVVVPRNDQLERGKSTMMEETPFATLRPNISGLIPKRSNMELFHKMYPMASSLASYQPRVNAAAEHFGLLRGDGYARMNGGLFGNSSASSSSTAFPGFRAASSSSEKGKAHVESSESGQKEIRFIDFLGVGDN